MFDLHTNGTYDRSVYDPYYRNPLVFGILIFTVMIGVFIWQETHTRKK